MPSLGITLARSKSDIRVAAQLTVWGPHSLSFPTQESPSSPIAAPKFDTKKAGLQSPLLPLSLLLSRIMASGGRENKSGQEEREEGMAAHEIKHYPVPRDSRGRRRRTILGAIGLTSRGTNPIPTSFIHSPLSDPILRDHGVQINLVLYHLPRFINQLE